MLAVEDLLCFDQLLVKLKKRQLRRQHGMLNIEKPVVSCLDLARLPVPALGSRVWSVNAYGHNFWDFQAPLPNRLESPLIPVRFGNQIDGHGNTKGTGAFQGFEVFPQ